MKNTKGVHLQGVQSVQVELHDIEERPEVYQPREGLQEYHVNALRAALGQRGELDPLTLWEDPETGAKVLVDGHHRVAAYRKAGWSKPVPSHIHKCNQRAARLLALGENGKARLSLTPTERQNAAWALVCDGRTDPWTFSRSEIANASGASTGLVAEMRRTRKQVEERGETLDPSWQQMLRSRRDQGPQEYTDAQREAWIEAKAAEVDDKVGKDLGFYATSNPEAVINVIMSRCNHECRRQLYDELMGEFEPERLEGTGDY